MNKKAVIHALSFIRDMDSTRISKLHKIANKYNKLLLKLEDYGMTMQESVEFGLPEEITRDLLRNIVSTEKEVAAISQVLSTISSEWKSEIAFFEQPLDDLIQQESAGNTRTMSPQGSTRQDTRKPLERQRDGKSSRNGILARNLVDESLFPRYSGRADPPQKTDDTSHRSGTFKQPLPPAAKNIMKVHPSRLGMVPGTDPKSYLASSFVHQPEPHIAKTAVTDSTVYYNQSLDPRSQSKPSSNAPYRPSEQKKKRGALY